MLVPRGTAYPHVAEYFFVSSNISVNVDWCLSDIKFHVGEDEFFIDLSMKPALLLVLLANIVGKGVGI